jgi:hypothetical protein
MTEAIHHSELRYPHSLSFVIRVDRAEPQVLMIEKR